MSCLLQDEFNVTAQNPRKENDIEYWMQKLGIHNVQFGKLNAGPESTVDDDTLFDGIISSGVLEHTFEYGQTDLEALRILHANLKDDGYLFIWNLPTKHSLSETYARMRKKWKHPVLYELDDILVKLTTAGFEVVAIERNEIFFSQLARLFPIIPLEVMWRFDHFLATNLLLKRFAHHFTIVAQKVAGFPQNPSRSLYTVYP